MTLEESNKSLQAKVAGLKTVYDNAIAELKTEFEAVVKEHVFDKMPEVKSISWHQYTPSWCDGGPCSFSCDATYGEFDINGYSRWDEDDYEEEGMPNIMARTTDDHPHYDEMYSAMEETILNILISLGDNEYKAIYGDGKKVTLTAEGSSTEYSDRYE